MVVVKDEKVRPRVNKLHPAKLNDYNIGLFASHNDYKDIKQRRWWGKRESGAMIEVDQCVVKGET